MFEIAKKAIGLIGGMSSIYSVLATVVIGGGTIWYYYDKYITTPIQEAQEKTEQCYIEANKTRVLNEEVIRQSGVVISNQAQTIYDLKHNVDEEIKLIECKSKVQKLKGAVNATKINKSNKYFYTHLPF